MIVPASSGLMGILPSHAPTVAQLRAGVVEVHDGEEKESFFVSSGFAFIHKDRTDVCAVEAIHVSFKRCNLPPPSPPSFLFLFLLFVVVGGFNDD